MKKSITLRSVFVASALLLLAPAAARAEITAAPGLVVSSTDIGGAVQGDVAFAGSAIFVATGTFGSQSILRIDDSGSTEVITGLNSVGGIIFDDASGVLYFLDNGYGPGAATGDTLYALPDAIEATATDAASLELLSSESIPAAAGLVMESNESILITDAAGDDLGRVLRYSISDGTLTEIINGFDYLAGISVSSAGTILVGNVDATSFVGTIEEISSDGTLVGTFSTPGGAFDQQPDADGNLLVTGPFAGDFSSSVVVSLDPQGNSTEIASGFCFSAGIDIDGPSGQVAVLDSCFPTAATTINRFTPTAGMTGLGQGKKDCNAALFGGVESKNAKGKGRKRWECNDGDLACDRDGEVNGSCTFAVGGCLEIDNPDSSCTAADVDEVEVKRAPKIAEKGAFPALQAAVDAIVGGDSDCSETVSIDVPEKKKVVVKLKAKSGGKTVDRDVVRLFCREALL